MTNMNDSEYLDYLAGLGAETPTATAPAATSMWGSFMASAKQMVGTIANTAMESYATSAANRLAKSLGTPQAAPTAKAAAATQRAAEPTSYGKYALLVGIPVVGIAAAIAVWKMSR